MLPLLSVYTMLCEGCARNVSERSKIRTGCAVLDPNYKRPMWLCLSCAAPEALEQASGGERRTGSEKDYCDTDDVARSLDAEEEGR